MSEHMFVQSSHGSFRCSRCGWQFGRQLVIEGRTGTCTPRSTDTSDRVSRLRHLSSRDRNQEEYQ